MSNANEFKKPSAFATWFNTFNEEKGIDPDLSFDVEGPSGTNFMNLDIVFEAILSAPAHEQAAIKTMLVKIDFANADVVKYYKHLAQAIAI